MKMSKDNFYFFWGGTCSQWANFDIEINKVVYCTNEQYMMASKAALFHDTDAYEEIMIESDPSKQKAIGRKVKNFNKDEWEEIARKVVYEANLAKFTQHPDLYDFLMETGDKEIVEASPYDCIWGIGLGASDERIYDRDQWRGTNWLGEALMEVRKELISQKLEEERKNESN